MNKLQAHASRLTQSAYDDYEEPTTKLSTAFVVVLVLHLVAVGGIYAFHSIKAKRREADGTAVTAKAVTAKAATPAPAATAATPAPAANVAVSSAAVVNSPKTAAAVHAAGVPAPAPGAASNGAVAPKVAASPTRGVNSASHLAPPVGPSAVIPAPKTPVQAQTPQSATSVAAKAQPPSVVPVKAVAVVPAVVPAGGAAAESAHKTYTVQKGDNPVAIAKRMGVGYDEMLKLNGIEDPKKLQIGQVLKMPAKKQAN